MRLYCLYYLFLIILVGIGLSTPGCAIVEQTHHWSDKTCSGLAPEKCSRIIVGAEFKI